LDEPRSCDTESRFKQLVGHDRRCALAARRPTGRSERTTAPLRRRGVNRHRQPVDLWTARRGAAHNSTGQNKAA
jgi:hypothetical protein